MSNQPFQFDKALKELEDITAWFESSQVDLDAALPKFERGMELSAQLKEHLQAVENKVEKIKAKFAPGAPAATETAATADPAADLDEQADTIDDTDQAGLF